MKKTFVILSLVVGFALPMLAQTVDRLDRIETPPSALILSNSTTAKIDFSSNAAPVADIVVEQLSGNITLYLTNLVVGRTRRVFIDVDGTTRNVTVSTNGLQSGTQVIWPVNSPTNGATSFSVTNQGVLFLTPRPLNRVWATYQLTP